MSQVSMRPSDYEADERHLSANWSWHLGMGILAVILGVIGLVTAGFVTLVSVIFFGWLLVFAGVMEMVHAFRTRGWKGSLLHGIMGVLWLILGVLIITNPGVSALTLTMALAFFFLVSGVVQILGAVTLRYPQWGWSVVSGAVSVLLGIFIMTRWPSSAFWVIGTFISIELLMNGWAMIALAMTAHKPGPHATTPSGARPAFG